MLQIGSDSQYNISDELLSNIKFIKQKEMYQGATKLEQLVDSDPHPLNPHIVKVMINNTSTITITYCIMGNFELLYLQKFWKSI